MERLFFCAGTANNIACEYINAKPVFNIKFSTLLLCPIIAYAVTQYPLTGSTNRHDL